jgi:hypothetical protein
VEGTIQPNDESGTNSQKQKGRRIPRFLILLIVIAITIAMISLTLWPGIQDDEDPLFQENDVLHYSISGEYGNRSIDGYIEQQPSNGWSSYTVLELPELSSWTGWSQDSLDTGPILTKDVLSKYTWIDNERIVTPIGEKAVKTMIRQIGLSVVIVDIGLQTSLIYKTVVSNPDYHYTILLNSTTSDRVRGADDRLWKGEIDSGLRVSDQPTGMGNLPGAGMRSWTMLKVKQGETLRYDIVGMNGTAYVFSMDDLKIMEETENFTFEHELSLINCSGSVNATVAPGLYWFIFYQDGTEEFVSNDCGWVYLYFDYYD